MPTIVPSSSIAAALPDHPGPGSASIVGWSAGERATSPACHAPGHARPDLLMLTDRALTRARRHAVILAGHRLRGDLARMNTLSAVPLRGTAGVLAAWANRAMKQRGVAVMVDTGSEASATGAELDTPLDPVPERVPDCPDCACRVARRALARCLAVALTVAVHTERCLWEGTFRVAEAIERAGWDVLSGHPDCDHRAKRGGGRRHDTAARGVARGGT